MSGNREEPQTLKTVSLIITIILGLIAIFTFVTGKTTLSSSSENNSRPSSNGDFISRSTPSPQPEVNIPSQPAPVVDSSTKHREAIVSSVVDGGDALRHALFIKDISPLDGLFEGEALEKYKLAIDEIRDYPITIDYHINSRNFKSIEIDENELLAEVAVEEVHSGIHQTNEECIKMSNNKTNMMYYLKRRVDKWIIYRYTIQSESDGQAEAC